MKRLSDTTFLLVGLGGLGSPLALALAAAGAGRLVLVDDDSVDDSNLQRQVLFRTADVGRPKAVAARDALARRGFTRVEPVPARFDESSARALLHDADVVCDGTDSVDTKFLVNDAAVAAGRPFVIAAAIARRGQVFPVRPGVDACYRCLFETPPDAELLTCALSGVLGTTCAEVAALQARAAVALATGHDPHALLGRFWLLEGELRRSIAPRPRPGCCGAASSELEEVAS